MNNWIIIGLVFGCVACQSSDSKENTTQQEWALAIHGGAGHFDEESLSVEMQSLYTKSINAALQIGEEQLISGASAVDVVEHVIRFLEDDSLFNAGRGAVYTATGSHELDASIADGSTRNCGAVTGLTGFRHPISVARGVMDSSEHVFFSGHGAGVFAQTQGFESESSIKYSIT